MHLIHRPLREKKAMPNVQIGTVRVWDFRIGVDNFWEYTRTLEIDILVEAMTLCLGNRQQAAKHLGINRTTLVERLRAHKMLDRDFATEYFERMRAEEARTKEATHVPAAV